MTHDSANSADSANPAKSANDAPARKAIDATFWAAFISVALMMLLFGGVLSDSNTYDQALYQANVQAEQTWAGAIPARAKFLQQLDLCDGTGAFPWSGSCGVLLAQQNHITSADLQELTRQAQAQEKRVHKPWLLGWLQ